jgi:hypothetical protein
MASQMLSTTTGRPRIAEIQLSAGVIRTAITARTRTSRANVEKTARPSGWSPRNG